MSDESFAFDIPIDDTPLPPDPVVPEEPIGQSEHAQAPEAPAPIPGAAPTSVPVEALLKQIEELQSTVDRLQQCFDEKIKTDTYKNGLFDNMHKELEKYQQGHMEDLTKPLVLDIIRLSDTVKSYVRFYEKREASEETYKRLKTSLNNVSMELIDILYRQSVEPYRVDGSVVDTRRQKIIGTVETENEKWNNLVAVRSADGYTMGDRVIRPERIKVYKYAAEAEVPEAEN